MGSEIEAVQRKRDATSWVAQSLREPRDWDKVTNLIALIEGESREQGVNPSKLQWELVMDVRMMVRNALLALINPDRVDTSTPERAS